MINKAIVKQEIQELLVKYKRLVEEKQVKKYNEEMTKKDFILPLFRILGWNVEDSSEVTAEETISKKRVDYGFRIGGITKFFLEAKPLKADLDDNKWIDQVINYAWLKGCTWAILTDFESIRIFNAEWKTDNILQSHLKSINLNEYIEKLDELWLLSRESFELGLLDREAEKWGKKTKKTPVDKQLLQDFTRFREMLSKSITKLNKSMNVSEEELDESVQRLLDRLIFIRNCEDKELEPPTLISELNEYLSSRHRDLIKGLRKVFENFDNDYDSKIFLHHLCDDVDIDNDVLIEVIQGLYTTKDNSISYDFSVIDADVLGNIYEQYLGHILKKSKKRAKITKEHAHRKEQGIYYTPTYIVDFIVRNTLGELLKNKKADVEKIRVLDPACGSGSFLLKAFDLINEFYYKKDKNYAQISLDWKYGTTYTTKVKILENNIFGVDLDRQAVEIAQLNLMLRIAEKKQKLPWLESSIKCGNSLIDDSTIVGDKAFKWQEQFKEIMLEGGFDVVIGNPPYGIVFKEDERHFIEERLPAFRRNNDLYVAFIEKAVNLLKEDGLFSFIVPNTYLIGPYFDNLKKFILGKTKIIKILDLGTNHIFQDANVFNSIIILQKESNNQKRDKNIIEFFDIPLLNNSDFFKLENISSKTEINQIQFNYLIWKPTNSIIENMNKQRDKLIDEICYVKDVGFNYWTIGRGKKRGGSIGSKVLYDGDRKNQKDIPYLKGRDIIPYNYVFGNHWLKHDYEKFLDKKVDIFRFSPEFLEVSPKIIYRQTADRVIATIDFNKYYLDKTVHLIIPKENVKLNMLFLLGILNSKLMLYFYRDLVREEGRIFAQVKTIYIKKIPIRLNEQLENRISELVKKQIENTKRLNEIGDKKTDERARIEEEIRQTDNEIDNLVYQIYGISKEEKIIIEDSL